MIDNVSTRLVCLRVLVMLSVVGATPGFAGSGSVHWVGMMLRFLPGNGVETRVEQMYSSTLALDTEPPQSLSPGLLTLTDDKWYVGATDWKATGYFRIESPGTVLDPIPRVDDFDVDLPRVDNDGDGIPDVLMIDRELPATSTTGSFEILGRSGAVEALWDRAAGSHQGRCVIHMSGTYQPGNPSAFFSATYTNVFELATIAGTLNFQTGASHTIGAWALGRTGDAYEYEGGTGDFSFSRTNADVLQLAPGFLRYYGPAFPAYTTIREFVRVGSNYKGFVSFANVVPGSFDLRYRNWVVGISTPEDSNGNQIPDFSDVAPAFAPQLSLQQTSTEFYLTITGEPAATYSVETTTGLGPPVWSGVTNITLGTLPDTLAVSPGDGSLGFWRATYP